MRKNGSLYYTLRFFVQVSSFAVLIQPLKLYGGNLEMVEKNVEELDSLNREAVRQIPGLPRDGTVNLKAYVTMDGDKPNIRIDEKKITIKNNTSPANGNKLSEHNVNVSAPAVDGKIEYTEENRQIIEDVPGGGNVYKKSR